MTHKVSEEHVPFSKSVRNYFREYCNCTSIHGFRYFGEKRTYFERIWWFFVFSLTFAACTISIREVYKKCIRSPLIVSLATKETPIYTIPFPAVTICPEIKSAQTLYSHTKVVQKFFSRQPLTKRETKILDYMSLICDENELIKYSNIDFFTDDFYTTIEEINNGTMPFQSCEYMGHKYSGVKCLKIFKPTITDEGICYTFNMLDKSEIFKDTSSSWIPSKYYKSATLTFKNWTMMDGYLQTVGLYPFPRRALLAGATNALSVTLNMSRYNQDYSCKRALQGFKVSLHVPSGLPRPSQEYFRVPLDEVVLAAVKPQMTTTDTAVQNYNPHERECYFPYEKNLKYFKLYTSGNCQLECLTNYTLSDCGCVNYFMPRDNTVKICGTNNLSCMKRAESRYQIGDLRSKLTVKTANSTRKFLNHLDLDDCNCMPMCSDLTYDTETSQSKWDWMEVTRAEKRNWSLKFEREDHAWSQLIIYVKSRYFIPHVRSELYGPMDFLANVGGLLGLFIGFSLLSVFEIIYFVSIRIICNIKMYKRWYGEQAQ